MATQNVRDGRRAWHRLRFRSPSRSRRLSLFRQVKFDSFAVYVCDLPDRGPSTLAWIHIIAFLLSPTSTPSERKFPQRSEALTVDATPKVEKTDPRKLPRQMDMLMYIHRDGRKPDIVSVMKHKLKTLVPSAWLSNAVFCTELLSLADASLILRTNISLPRVSGQRFRRRSCICCLLAEEASPKSPQSRNRRASQTPQSRSRRASQTPQSRNRRSSRAQRKSPHPYCPKCDKPYVSCVLTPLFCWRVFHCIS